MFEKREKRTTAILVRVTPAEAAALREKAQEWGMTASEAIREALKAYLTGQQAEGQLCQAHD